MINYDSSVNYANTVKFKRKYSTPLSKEDYDSYRTKDSQKIKEDFKQLIKDFEQHEAAEQKEIIKYQAKLPYTFYLNTRYWCICRNKKMDDDNFHCRLFAEHFGILNVHHNSYAHRGNDAYHLDCLITLCEDCHEWNEMRESKNKNKPFTPRQYNNTIQPDKLEEFQKKIDDFQTADKSIKPKRKRNGVKVKKTPIIVVDKAKEVLIPEVNKPFTIQPLTNAVEYLRKACDTLFL